LGEDRGRGGIHQLYRKKNMGLYTLASWKGKYGSVFIGCFIERKIRVCIHQVYKEENMGLYSPAL